VDLQIQRTALKLRFIDADRLFDLPAIDQKSGIFERSGAIRQVRACGLLHRRKGLAMATLQFQGKAQLMFQLRTDRCIGGRHYAQSVSQQRLCFFGARRL